jgi:hypothetical protein
MNSVVFLQLTPLPNLLPYICIENKTRKIMKTKNVILTALVATFVSVLAFAKDPGTPKVVVVNQKSGVFKVIYDGQKSSKVTMRILSANGTEVFSENLGIVSGFVRPVNFTGMADGEYTIEIADNAGAQSTKVRYNKEKATNSVVREKATNSIHIARLAQGSKYLLAVANKGSEQINVKIFDGSNNLVHDENMTVTGNFGLVYNLTQVAGTPTFEVSDKTGNVKTIKY